MSKYGRKAIWRGGNGTHDIRRFAVVGKPRMFGRPEPLTPFLQAVSGVDLSDCLGLSTTMGSRSSMLILSARGAIDVGPDFGGTLGGNFAGARSTRSIPVGEFELATIVAGNARESRWAECYWLRPASAVSRCVEFRIARTPPPFERSPEPDGGPWIDLVRPTAVEPTSREWRRILGEWNLKLMWLDEGSEIRTVDRASVWLQVIQGCVACEAPARWWGTRSLELSAGDGIDLALRKDESPPWIAVRRTLIAQLSRATDRDVQT